MKGIIIYLLLLTYIAATLNQEKIDSSDEPELKIPKSLCKWGKIVNNKCVCPKDEEYFAGYCRKYTPPTCHNGKVVNRKCTCPKNKRLILGFCI